jgi:3-carboxy-cis,cis-muconate cycloisomerase
MLGGLIVDAERMRDNLGPSGGLIVAEAVMMAAAPKLGRQRAHDVVYDACRTAVTGKRLLADVLLDVPESVEALGGAAAIRHHCDPANYLGLAPQMVDHMLSQLPGAGRPGPR